MKLKLSDHHIQLITQEAIKAYREYEKKEIKRKKEEDEFFRLIHDDGSDPLSSFIDRIKETPNPIEILVEEVLKDFIENQKKRQIPAKIKRLVEEKCEGVCNKCKSQALLQYHHIKPFSEGGRHTVDNIILLCAYCHTEEHKGERIYNMMKSRLPKRDEVIEDA